MNKLKHILGKVVYSIIFLCFLPVLLWLWAKYTEDLINIPMVKSMTAGWILIVCGALFMLWGMYALIRYGKGMPMNAYPPIHLVKRGPYRIFKNPIYFGFSFLMTGFFILMRMASGFWLVTPVTILGMIALVWGYEKIDIKKRFPGQTYKTLFHLPEDKDSKTTLSDQLTALVLVSGFLLLSNFLLLTWSGMPYFQGNKVINGPKLGIQYLTVFSTVFIFISPFLLRKKYLLRKWTLSAVMGLWVYTFISLLYSIIRIQNLPKSEFLMDPSIEYTLDLFYTPVFLIIISLKEIFKKSIRQGIVFSFVAFLLIIIQLANIQSAISHLIVSCLILVLVVNYERIWTWLRDQAEWIANSWHEWEFGKMRVINHGFYTGFGTFLGILFAGILVGKTYAWGILVFAIIVIVFAAFWAQIIEGSEKLKRPFGYYGGLIGILFACPVLWALGLNAWVIIGVLSVIMPLVQGIGRLRCLVNGCCHGSRTDNPRIGIRYYHHRSRVCSISGLKGERLYPTPIYAFIWLFLIGFVLLGLWLHHFPPSFIFGMYLILTGIGRFVEEGYRGEVQTPIIKGMRLYQWMAILSVLTGMIISVIKTKPIVIQFDLDWNIAIAAVLGGLFSTFAFGIDFPRSNARFSRLV